MDKSAALIDQSCKDFSERLASKSPVPGGGGASALVGALAAALCSMVAHYSLGKKKLECYTDELSALLLEADTYRDKLLRLVEDDAAAFAPLSAAYTLPKDDPQKSALLEHATQKAAEPPLEMMRTLTKVIAVLERMEQIGSHLLISDVGCGAYFAEAALKAAALNVFVNTASYKDRLWAQEVNALAKQQLTGSLSRVQALAERVFKDMTSEG